MRSVSNDQKQNVKECQQEEEGYPFLTQANDFFFFPLDSTKDLYLKAPEWEVFILVLVLNLSSECNF